MIWFCYFWKKKKVFVLDMALLHKLGQKMVIFRGLANFFQNYWIPIIKVLNINWIPNIFNWKPAKKFKVCVVLGQNLDQILIKSNVVKKVKKQALSLVFKGQI